MYISKTNVRTSNKTIVYKARLIPVLPERADALRSKKIYLTFWEKRKDRDICGKYTITTTPNLSALVKQFTPLSHKVCIRTSCRKLKTLFKYIIKIRCEL